MSGRLGSCLRLRRPVVVGAADSDVGGGAEVDGALGSAAARVALALRARPRDLGTTLRRENIGQEDESGLFFWDATKLFASIW